MKRLTAMAVGSFVAVATAQGATAATMTFNSFEEPSGRIFTAPHTEDGITMAPDIAGGHYDIYGDILGGTLADNVAAIHYGNDAERARFTFAGGNFNLVSFDLSGWLVRDTDPIVVDVTASTGAVVTLDSNSVAPGIQDFSAVAGFSNISWFTIGVDENLVESCTNCSIMGFDDVTIGTISAVPLPAGLPLLLTGLGGLALMRGRRRRG